MPAGTLSFHVDVIDHASPVLAILAGRAWNVQLSMLDDESREWYARVAQWRWLQQARADEAAASFWWKVRQQTLATRWAIGERTGSPHYLSPSKEVAVPDRLAVPR